MSWSKKIRDSVPLGSSAPKRAFTLVELLVVIGIIALLIAILMPALSRARKQALQVSCGSNERQIAYAMLAYANDWKELLPNTKQSMFEGACIGTSGVHLCAGRLFDWTRLPIIGFDTTTDPLAFIMLCTTPLDAGCADGAGVNYKFRLSNGQAYLTRDYLKNDMDVVMCPDGWWTRDFQICRDGGGHTNSPCSSTGRGPVYAAGYEYIAHAPAQPKAPCVLPQNGAAMTTCSGSCGISIPGVSGIPYQPYKSNEIPRTASDTPDLIILADYFFATEGVGTYASANHWASSFKNNYLYSTDWPVLEPSNPASQPLGTNVTRIDARVTWRPFQEMKVRHEYCQMASWNNCASDIAMW